jgi:hypothetical protein
MKNNMWFTSWVDGKCSTFKGSSLEAPKAGKRILLSFEIILNPPTKNITIFRSIILFYGIDNVPQIIPYISHITPDLNNVMIITMAPTTCKATTNDMEKVYICSLSYNLSSMLQCSTLQHLGHTNVFPISQTL